MNLSVLPLMLPFVLGACARTDIYYPSDGKAYIGDGPAKPYHNRAVVLNGSDSLGHTRIAVNRNGVTFESAGGIDNSTSTREGYRTVRFGIASAAWAAGAVGVANVAANAFGANQAASATSSAAASKASAATAASKSAETVRLAEIAAAAQAPVKAGATIPAVVPAVVTPVP